VGAAGVIDGAAIPTPPPPSREEAQQRARARARREGEEGVVDFRGNIAGKSSAGTDNKLVSRAGTIVTTISSAVTNFD